ncbi:MAG: prepilin peptidase [Aggregatilineales bacterium]
MSFAILLAALFGFIVGVYVNLFADYRPAQRLYRLARASPFVSESGLPPIPRPLPRFPDGRVAPVYLWSGVIAWFAGRNYFDNPRWIRRIAVEIGLAVAYGWIVSFYGASPYLPFFLFCAPFLVLISVIDIEYRWILAETLWPLAIVVVLDSAFNGTLTPTLRGGLYGFGTLLIIFILGQVFKQSAGALGRRIGQTVFGFADVELGIVGGLLVGWPNFGLALLVTIFLAAAGALGVIGGKMTRGRRYRGGAAIPYGPYIVLGVAIMLYAPWLMVGVLDLLLRLL